MDHINKMWERYRDMALPKNASVRLKVEAKLGFYAGCTALFSAMGSRLEDDKFSAEQGQKFINEVSSELERFVDNLDSITDEFEKEMS